ncbi:MAG: ArsR family transcriptional regulator [Archaeoglobaceae archaeon]
MFETRLNPSIIDRHLKALSKLGLVTKEGERTTSSRAVESMF